MKSVKEIRLINLEELVVEYGTLEAIANACQMPNTVYLSQIRSRQKDVKTGEPRNMGDKTARKLEDGCNKPHGWMDAEHHQAGESFSEGNKTHGLTNLDSSEQELISLYRLLKSKKDRGSLIGYAQDLLDSQIARVNESLQSTGNTPSRKKAKTGTDDR